MRCKQLLADPGDAEAALTLEAWLAHSPGWGLFNDQGRQLQLAVSGNLEFSQDAPAIEPCVAGVGFGVLMSYWVAPF